MLSSGCQHCRGQLRATCSDALAYSVRRQELLHDVPTQLRAVVAGAATENYDSFGGRGGIGQSTGRHSRHRRVLVGRLPRNTRQHRVHAMAKEGGEE